MPIPHDALRSVNNMSRYHRNDVSKGGYPDKRTESNIDLFVQWQVSVATVGCDGHWLILEEYNDELGRYELGRLMEHMYMLEEGLIVESTGGLRRFCAEPDCFNFAHHVPIKVKFREIDDRRRYLRRRPEKWTDLPLLVELDYAKTTPK